MKPLTRRAFVLALICSLILAFVPQVTAQKNTTPQPVKVVNTTANPVPTVAQGTTAISGSVTVTNSSIPVAGNVNVTNSSLPVTGTVSVGNLPFDSNGNVRTSVTPAAGTRSYTYVLAYQCLPTSPGYQDLCVYGQYNQSGWPPNQTVLASTVLATLGGQGYDLVSVTPITAPSPITAPGFSFVLKLP